MLKLTIDTKELRAFEADLLQLAKRGLPYATRKTINDLAWKAREEWQESLGKTFILRNQFTRRSILVEQARGSKIQEQQSAVGSVAQYMLTQEEGGTLRGRGQSKPVPTVAARVSGSLKKLVSRPNRMSRIQLKARHGNSQAQRNAVQIAQSKKSGSKFVYLEKGAKRGIFRRFGGKRTTRLVLVQNLSHRTVTIRPRETMGPAVQRALLWGPQFYYQALQFQLARAKSPLRNVTIQRA